MKSFSTRGEDVQNFDERYISMSGSDSKKKMQNSISFFKYDGIIFAEVQSNIFFEVQFFHNEISLTQNYEEIRLFITEKRPLEAF